MTHPGMYKQHGQLKRHLILLKIHRDTEIVNIWLKKHNIKNMNLDHILKFQIFHNYNIIFNVFIIHVTCIQKNISILY